MDGDEVAALLDTGAAYTLRAEGEGGAPTSGCDINGCRDTYFISSMDVCVEDHCAAAVEVKYPVWDAVGANWLAGFRMQLAAGRLVLCDP
jgi:hypothetical protein